jgi:hypothetical protein
VVRAGRKSRRGRPCALETGRNRVGARGFAGVTADAAAPNPGAVGLKGASGRGTPPKQKTRGAVGKNSGLVQPELALALRCAPAKANCLR